MSEASNQLPLSPEQEQRATYGLSEVGSWGDVFGNAWRGQTDLGIEVNEHKVLGLPAFLSGTRFIASAISGLPRRVLRDAEEGQVRERSHPLQRVISGRANRLGQSSRQVFAQAITHAAWWGSGYVWCPRSPDGTRQLYNLLPDRTHVATIEDQRFAITFPRGRVPGELPEAIPLDEVLHLYVVSYDGINGLSLVDLLRTNLGLALASEEFGARFFGRGTTASMAVESEHKLTSEQMDGLRNSIRKGYSGLKNSFGVPVLPFGAKIKPLSVPPESAQFLQTREFAVRDIARAMRLPPAAVGDYGRATYANVEHQQIELTTYCLKDWVDQIEAESWKLFDEEDLDAGLHLHLDLNGLLRGDRASRHSAYQVAIQSGWMTRQEVRRLENLGEGPAELEEYLYPLNLVVVGREQSASPTTGEANGATDEDDGQGASPSSGGAGDDTDDTLRQTLGEAPSDEARRHDAFPKTVSANVEEFGTARVGLGEAPSELTRCVVADAFKRIAAKEVKAVEVAVRRHLDKGDGEAFAAWAADFTANNATWIASVLTPLRSVLGDVEERAKAMAQELHTTLEEDDPRLLTAGWPTHRAKQAEEIR